MYGFLVVKGNAKETKPAALIGCRKISCKDITMYYAPLPKFENDHLFYEDETKIVLLDGVVFNKKELLTQYGKSDWRSTFEILYAKNQTLFFNQLRGSFCGAVYEKKKDALCLFTNQSGERMICYTHRANLFAAATHNNILVEFMKEQGMTVSPNIQACRELLAMGSVLHGGTPFEGIFRLMAGNYVLLDSKGSCQEQRYHMFHNIPEHDLSLDECIEELDKRFRKAVDRIFSKNTEYGYKAECDLSGGLDSRMATWVAHDLGYKNILNVCYCQSGKIDHKTSQKVAHDLGNDYFFLPMDNGEILKDVDEVVDKFGAQLLYFMCTGANRAVKEMSSRGVGLSVTGLMGGEVHNAYWVEGSEHTPPRYTSDRYSKIVPLTVPESYSNGYENYEQMNLYEYGYLQFLSSAIVRQQYCETATPYVDVDYLEFAYRIPLKWRQNYCLMPTWMMKKYPEAAKYVWQAARMPVENYFNHKLYWPKVLNDFSYIPKQFTNRVARRLKIPFQFSQCSDMNPVNLWVLQNKDLQNFFENYYRDHINDVSDQSLRKDIQKTFEKGYGMDKTMAINLLGVYKRYFLNR